MDWTDEAIAHLRRLWGEGLSTNAIAQQMHMTKNAVVGKAHRLGLSARPNPIKRRVDGAAPPPPSRPKAPKLTELVTLQAPTQPAVPVILDPEPQTLALPTTRYGIGGRLVGLSKNARREAMVGRTLADVAPTAAPQLPTRTRLGDGCRFVTDATRGKQRFCDEPCIRRPSRGGDISYSSYCAEHHAICFMRPAKNLNTTECAGESPASEAREGVTSQTDGAGRAHNEPAAGAVLFEVRP
jgi:hypothetical protein